MKKYIRTGLIIFIAFLIVGSCNGSGGSNTTTRTIGPEGGTIKSADGKLTLEIPAGALTEDTEITVRRLNADDLPPVFGGVDTERQYELGPDGLEFNVPIDVEYRTDQKALNEAGNLTVDFSQLLTSLGGELETLNDNTNFINAQDNTVIKTGTLEHFSNLVETNFGGVVTTEIANVPEIIPLNTPFTVNASVLIPEGLSPNLTLLSLSALYKDESVADVFRQGFSEIEALTANQGDLVPLRGSFDYICENNQATTGVFQAVIELEFSTQMTFFGQTGIIDESDINVFTQDIVCPFELPEPTSPPPPPPPPTTMPTPPPASNCADFSGVYNLVCDLDRDPLVIVPNFGDPYIVSVEINIDPVTGEVTVEAAQGETTPFIPLEGAADFITNFGFDPQFVELRGPEGSGCEFDAMGSAFINGGDLLGEAEDWGLAFDAIGNQLLLPGAVLNINFEIFPAPNLSTVYICEGQGAGQ